MERFLKILAKVAAIAATNGISYYILTRFITPLVHLSRTGYIVDQTSNIGFLKAFGGEVSLMCAGLVWVAIFILSTEYYWEADCMRMLAVRLAGFTGAEFIVLPVSVFIYPVVFSSDVLTVDWVIGSASGIFGISFLLLYSHLKKKAA